MDTLHKVQHALIGTAGMVGTQVTPEVLEVATISPGSWVQAVTQVIIAVATLVGLFKNRKSSISK